jgi:hypothetical protein
MPGEKINFRQTNDFSFLCAICNKIEDPFQTRTITCLGTIQSQNNCFICGRSTENYNIINENGNFLTLCSDCADEEDFE